MDLKFLGKGSAFSDLTNTSAFFIKEDTLYLLDCGENVFSKKIPNLLAKYDLKYVNVFITHMHSDHIGSLPSLIFYCKYILNITPKIFFPEPEKIKTFLKVCGVSEDFYDTSEKDNLDFLFNDIKFSFIKVKHVKELNCYAFSIKNENKKIFYSGDLSELPLPICRILEYDEIYLECCLEDYDENVHLSLSKICGLFDKKDYKKVYLMHFDNIVLRDITYKLDFGKAQVWEY